jgi:acetyl-CoA carboxylase beta subunit
MELTSFIAGFLSAALTYAMFSDKKRLEPVEVMDDDSDYENTTGRRITMMCTSCRKQKQHIEIEKDLYQCTKCKRQVDLRRG